MLKPLIDFIRIFSEHARIVTPSQIAALAKIEWDEDMQKEFLKNWDELKKDPDNLDLEYIQDNSDIEKPEYYLYSTSFMVPSFAMNLFRVEKGDTTNAIAELIRKFSNQHNQVYPASNLTYPPFKLEEDDFKELRNRFQTEQLFSDIKEVINDEGELHFHSTLGISQEYAITLANYNPEEHV